MIPFTIAAGLSSYHNLFVLLCLFLILSLSLSPVKPYPPENVTVAVMGNKSWPFLRVSWEPPRKADTASGWITLIYELRVKLEGEHEWQVGKLFKLNLILYCNSSYNLM